MDFYLTHSLSSLLYNILRQGFAGKVRTLWMVHTNAPPPYPDRKRHNEPSVLSARGGHAQKKVLQSLPDLRMSWLVAKVSEIILHSSQYFM